MPEQEKQSLAAIIIDDDPLVIRLFKRFFTKAGFRVETASDGQRGLELIQQSKPDIVLLDLRLPVLDGFEVLKRIRQDEKTKQTPVVCFSGIGDRPGIAEECKNLGAKDCITKGSMSPDAVVKRILQFIGRDDIAL